MGGFEDIGTALGDGEGCSRAGAEVEGINDGIAMGKGIGGGGGGYGGLGGGGGGGNGGGIVQYRHDAPWASPACAETMQSGPTT